MKRIVSILGVIVLSLAMLTGCLKPTTTDQELPNQSGGKIASEFTDAEGVFNGKIDENSVQITMGPQDAVTFRIDDVADEIINIESGDKVKFSYAPGPDHGLSISKIEVIE